VLPVAPRPGAEPIRVLVRAVKGGGAGRLPDAPVLVLNDDAGKPTEAAEAVLREARPLEFAD
jgi:tRNA1(Val) A37 N6-methylase TrmN6